MYSDNSLSTDRNDGSPSPSAGQSTKPSASGRKSSTEDRVHRCSYCGNDFKRSESKNMPFCSRRCQQIDLGMWLNESYGFPHEGQDAAADYDPEA
jgi:endogenous inhibitor of DNA gyrase (YacG/DUF329 family)